MGLRILFMYHIQQSESEKIADVMDRLPRLSVGGQDSKVLIEINNISEGLQVVPAIAAN